MTVRELRKILKARGCTEVRQKGSHLFIRCGGCTTVIPMHGGDISFGVWQSIKKQLAPCLGPDWWL